MEATTRSNHDCLCCISTRFASHLAKFELFLWIILFILTFVLQEDLKDPIWLVSSISIFLFLLLNTSLEIYGLSIKNFCIVLSCGISRLCLIALGNLAVIVLAFLVEVMKEDQLTYLCVGVPICIYNFIKAITLFKAAHRIRIKEKVEREFKRHLHYNRQISIPHPEFHQEQKLDQFVNPQQQLYPQYQTMNTANLAIHPYHQNTMQYIQPTLYSVSVPQSADLY